MLVLLAAITTLTHAAEPPFTPVLTPRAWSFPKDHGRHDGFKTEWWYFTGNLREKSTNRRFGYQLTFFRSSIVPTATTRPSPFATTDLYFAHAAISDVQGQRFVYADRLSRGRPNLAHASDTSLDVVLKDWSTKTLAPDSFHLIAKDKRLTIDLKTHPGRGPILQGPGGVNAKGKSPGQASYYYSMTRLPTAGTLTVDGQTFDVEGLSWLDREFSSAPLGDDQAGWDWLAITLSDGADLMIYQLRDKAGKTDYLSGTRIDKDGNATFLTAADIKLTPAKPWKSPNSGATYPSQWTLTVPGTPRLVITTRIADQELQTPNSTDVTYYEGTVNVRDEKGTDAGDGYLEMTGYAKPVPK